MAPSEKNYWIWNQISSSTFIKKGSFIFPETEFVWYVFMQNLSAAQNMQFK